MAKTSKPKSAFLPKDYDKFLMGIVDQLNTEAGDDVAQLLGDRFSGKGLGSKVPGVLSTQCATIDAAIGRGGIPFGRLVIVHGDEASGKTTLALHLAAECQRRQGVVLYFDKEYKLDLDYAKRIGVDTDRMIISQPPYLERCFQIMELTTKLVSAKIEKTSQAIPILFVLDSMNAAIAKIQYEGEWDSLAAYGPTARVYSQKLPKLMRLVKQENIALVFISQVRDKIGITWGDKKSICGGRAPKFHASVIMEVKRIGSIKKGVKKEEEEDPTESGIIGNRTQVYITKNQIAPPFRQGNFDILYAKGIDKVGALLMRAEALGIVEKSGSWYSLGDDRLGNGLSAAIKMVEAHPEVLKRLESLVRGDLVIEAEYKIVEESKADVSKKKRKKEKKSK